MDEWCQGKKEERKYFAMKLDLRAAAAMAAMALLMSPAASH